MKTRRLASTRVQLDQIDSLAICFLHAYTDTTMSPFRDAGTISRHAISCSGVLAPTHREFERLSTV